MPVECQIHALFGISETGFDKKQKGALFKTNDGALVIRTVDKLELPVQRYPLSTIRKKRFGLLGIENESVQWVDTRIIACTSKNLKRMINEGRFHKDLYYLLKAFGIALPRASERRMDLEILLDGHHKKYLRRHARYHVLTPGTGEEILNFQWDNNDVQLESFCERMILTVTRRKISGEYVQSLLDSLYDLSEQEVKIPQVSSGRGFLEEAKIKDIRDASIQYSRNRTPTAKHLNISTSTLWRHMKKYKV